MIKLIVFKRNHIFYESTNLRIYSMNPFYDPNLLGEITAYLSVKDVIKCTHLSKSIYQMMEKILSDNFRVSLKTLLGVFSRTNTER